MSTDKKHRKISVDAFLIQAAKNIMAPIIFADEKNIDRMVTVYLCFSMFMRYFPFVRFIFLQLQCPLQLADQRE